MPTLTDRVASLTGRAGRLPARRVRISSRLCLARLITSFAGPAMTTQRFSTSMPESIPPISPDRYGCEPAPAERSSARVKGPAKNVSIEKGVKNTMKISANTSQSNKQLLRQCPCFARGFILAHFFVGWLQRVLYVTFSFSSPSSEARFCRCGIWLYFF